MELVIAEKPSVAQSIAAVLGATQRKDGYLEGNEYLVSWCVGHLVELAQPESYEEAWKKWSYESLPIIPQEWQHEVKSDTKAQYQILKKLMHDDRVDAVVCATDAGREGELIFRLTYNMAGCRKPMKRLWISSMEESAIRDGFHNLRPGSDYDNLYHSALCRQEADWLVGINGTRLFTVLYGGKALKVGRVQTPTLAMLVDRESKIMNFKKEAYYMAHIMGNGLDAVSEHISDKTEAERIAGACENGQALVTSVVKEEKWVAPPKLYDLTTLQRDANRLFGFTAKQTLEYTQSLYEKKLVTYPRTDSQYLSDDMEGTAKNVIEAIFNSLLFEQNIMFNPDIKRILNSKKVTDHHAIIPTMEIIKQDLKAIPESEMKILSLCANRLLCATGEKHIYNSTKAVITCNNTVFKVSGKEVWKNGWKEFEDFFKNSYKTAEDKSDAEEEKKLPELHEGMMIAVEQTKVSEHFTQPPKHYTDVIFCERKEWIGIEERKFSMRRKKDRSNGITALYERLSRDDDNAGESNSIVHQKQMLEDYAIKHGFTNLVHFTDDGWSGATFDRPSWNRLVEGVKNGEITACICKDMSRIGRDHLQVGFFTDILFREKEVRFIAINNGIDSDRQETSEFAPFLNIMNEWFVRDTSKKIKAVLKSRGSSGNAHTSNIPPYGYLKDPENPDHWIIDEEAAEVVRRIYRMTIEGKGPYQIARELSEEKIERPSYYLGKKGLGNHASNYDKENPYMWRGNQVTTLIARPEYIGKTVNFRTFKNSYKDKKTKRADKEDWVVFDDTQEPIVDEETWLLAQKLRQNVRKADPMGEPNVLTGKIYCADCGAPMYNHRQRKGRERIYYTAKGEKRTSYSNPADCYECSTYNLAYQKYDRHCTCHHISTKALKSIILKTIQETCHYVSLNEREFVYSLQEESAMKDIAVSETVKNRIERNQKRVHELDMLIRKIYEDNVIGRLPDRLFQSMLTDYENEQNELNKIIETDTADMQRIIGGQNNVERFLKLVKKYENITELTPAMINEFIDKILVHEPQGKGADRTTEVEIYLNYVGQFQVPVEQHEPTEEERIAAEKEAERLRRKRESNRKYMKKIREKSKEFAEHERIAEEKSSDSNVCVEQNATSKSNRQKVKGEKIA